jgi:hypothetical protein
MVDKVFKLSGGWILNFLEGPKTSGCGKELPVAYLENALGELFFVSDRWGRLKNVPHKEALNHNPRAFFGREISSVV